MQAEFQDLDVLLQIQRIDLEVMQKKGARGKLPQRIEMVKVRKKRDEIAPKLEQVASMQKAKEAELTAIEDEDRGLAEKQKRAQADIEASGKDFRAVEAHSRDLDGIVKRRVTLEEKSLELHAALDKIKAVRTQVEDALALCDQRECDLRASFQEQDDALIAGIRSLLAERANLARALPADLLKLYDATAAKTAGVAIGRLLGDTCGVCRTTLEGGHLIELRGQAPLGECPNCKRLLVIGDDPDAES